MRIAIASSLLIIAGCAGQPSTPAPQPPTRIVSNAPVVSAPGSATGTPDTAKAVVNAKRMGYTVVDENGQKMYCHKDARTGSHLVTETTCMTEKQMQDLREQTQRSLQMFEMQSPPPSGK